jgi:hypothetical protein
MVRIRGLDSSLTGEYAGTLSWKVIMKNFMRKLVAAVILLLGATLAMATEEAPYTVVEKDNAFEIRDYAPHILAETIVEGTLEEAGNIAFDRLFRYISGANKSRNRVTMTAPVSQQSTSEKIKMTAPVGQQSLQGGWVVSFMMPASYTLETLPQPADPLISLRQVAARRIAAIRYSGFWSEKAYLQHKQELELWIRQRGLTVAGEPIWARYNPPFMPWFLRRNEILIPVQTGDN